MGSTKLIEDSMMLANITKFIVLNAYNNEHLHIQCSHCFCYNHPGMVPLQSAVYNIDLLIIINQHIVRAGAKLLIFCTIYSLL